MRNFIAGFDKDLHVFSVRDILDNMGQFVAPFASLGRVTLDRRASSKRPVSISGITMKGGDFMKSPLPI